MKHALAILITLLGLLFTLSVRADVAPTYHVRWTFTELLGYQYSDYSTNLDIPLGATLPTAAVKAGWACVREPVFQRNLVAGMPCGEPNGACKTHEEGEFRCSDGQGVVYAYASCLIDRIDTDYSYLDITLPGAPGGIRFSVSCAALLQ